MEIIVAHNHYQQPGGEDTVAAQEIDLLKSAGHHVAEYLRFNSEINPVGISGRIKIARQTLWASDTKREFNELIAKNRPAIAHFHNTFPLISPSAYYACQEAGVAVVQTLHNYRLLCPAAIFSRGEGVCVECVGKTLPWPSVRHSCYRNSRAQTTVVATMLTAHRWLRTWQEQVDIYIALTEFARQKFIEGGLPAEKLVVKPNFIHPDPGIGSGNGKYALFVGRLSPEKGVETMLSAWERLGGQVPLKIIGDGPSADRVAEAARRLTGVEWMGRLPKEQVLALMKDAAFLLFPSTWYEGFPMVIAEAYAVGLPIIASNLGSMSSLIDSGRTGLHFRPGDADALAAQVEWALSHPVQLARMRHEARAEFEAKYTAERNYEMLMKIYQTAVMGSRPQTVSMGSRSQTVSTAVS